MFSRIKDFFSRHKRKFIIGGIAVGTGVLLMRYTQRKLREWHERETKELLERTRRQLHFDSIERTCNQTALTLAPNLSEYVNKYLETEEILTELRNGTSNKVELWEKLKILSFAKVASLIYGNAMLMVTLRIQLNLIGGYMFRSTNEDNIQINSTLQGKYLSLCQHFVEAGVEKLCVLIERNVRNILKDKSLKEKLTLYDVEQIFWSIQSTINSSDFDPVRNLQKYIMPEPTDKLYVEFQDPQLRNILTETVDLLESEEIGCTTLSCISRGFSHVTDQIAEYYISVSSNSVVAPKAGTSQDVETDNSVNVSNTGIHLAKLIPIVNGIAQNGKHPVQNTHSWMEQLVLMDKLKILGANIYEAFSHKG